MIEAMAELALPSDEDKRTPMYMDRLRIGLGSMRFLIIAPVVLLLLYLSLTVVPAGHVGVKDFFGAVSDRVDDRHQDAARERLHDMTIAAIGLPRQRSRGDAPLQHPGPHGLHLLTVIVVPRPGSVSM